MSLSKRHVFTSTLVVIGTVAAVSLYYTAWYSMHYTHEIRLLHDNADTRVNQIVNTPKSLMPLDCQKFLVDLFAGSNQYNIHDPNDGTIHAKLSRTKPPFWTSVHHRDYDVIRYDSIYSRGAYYEHALTSAIVEILNNYTSTNTSIVLDVGGNIGWYSLLSASLGYHVHVFEPNLVNGIRICQSMQLNQFDDRNNNHHNGGTMNYYSVGVGDKDTHNSIFYLNPTPWQNPGAATFVKPRTDASSNKTSVQVITLDQFAQDKGWFDNDNTVTKIPILKMDVEGYEAQVMRGAQRLLTSGLIDNVFMENGKDDNQDALKQMFTNVMEAGYVLHKFGKRSGPDNLYRGPHNHTTKFLLEDLIPKSRVYVNLWWKKETTTIDSW